MAPPIVCTPRMLPRNLWILAAKTAIKHNPMNSAPIHGLRAIVPDFQLTPERLAVVTTKYWRSGGVHLKVGFLDKPAQDLRSRILLHMNAWAKTANVEFVESATEPEVRIAREKDGYWSYVGTDILHIE